MPYSPISPEPSDAQGSQPSADNSEATTGPQAPNDADVSATSGADPAGAGDTGNAESRFQDGGPIPPGPQTAGGVWQIVDADDCINSLAYQHGLFWETIWSDPANEPLRQRRENPNVLLAGDAVFCRERIVKAEPGATELRHRFRRRGEPVTVRVRVMEDDEPRGNEAYEFHVGQRVYPGMTDPQGWAEVPLPSCERRGVLVLLSDGTQVPLNFGQLDPLSELHGVQQRLENLGFSCGARGELDDETRGALSAFQERFGLTETGEPDEATRNKLRELHGS